MSSIRPSDIAGTWTLETFEIESPEGVSRPWGRDSSGLLIYSDTGRMSVSINKAVEADPEQTDSENLFDSILFYSGTYSVDPDGSVVRHKVTNASNPSRIGKDLVRYPALEGDLLTLASPLESFGTARLTWRRVRR